MRIKVMVSGSGKMGREVLTAVAQAPDMEPVGVVDLLSAEEYISVPGTDALIPFDRSPAAMIVRTRPDVVVDFTSGDWTPKVAGDALEAGVRLVIGTTGLPEKFISHLQAECAKRGVGGVVAPNFAIGAVLMQHMAQLAARYFDHAEIIEEHHEGKLDAPSGTSIATARAMAAGRDKPMTVPHTQRETVPGTRGATVDGVTIHSVRLPGLVAHQEVIFGNPGETLRIRHDTVHRESFMPGVLLAVRKVMERNDLVVGLDRLIGLA